MKQVKHISIFEPYPWQEKAWKDFSFILLCTGSAGGGKSRLCAEKIHALMLRYPGSTGLVLRKAREVMNNSTVPQLCKVMGINEGVTSVEHKPSSHRFEYKNGSVLVYGGMKDAQQRESIRSIGQDGSIDFVWMEEANAFVEEDFNEILGRMRGNKAGWRQIMLSTNPDSPNHWIYKRLILGKEASFYFSSAADNPANPEEYLRVLNSLTGVQKDRLALGKWVQAEGVIYSMFDYSKHVRDIEISEEFNKYKQIFGGADSNYPLPRAGLIMAHDAKGIIYVLDEFYEPNSPVEKLGQWYSDFVTHYKTSIQLYHDPSDPDSIVRLSKFAGVRCDKALNAVNPGISCVASMLSAGTLVISSRCVNLIKYMQSYKWKAGHNDEPEKIDDHIMDALRYGVYTHINKPKSGRMLGAFMS